MKTYKYIILTVVFLMQCGYLSAQDFTAARASVHQGDAVKLFDGNKNTGWRLEASDLKQDQYLMLALKMPGNIREIRLVGKGITSRNIQKLVSLYITYDPMNPGEPVSYEVQGNKELQLTFQPRYGAHLLIQAAGGALMSPVTLNEVSISYAENYSRKDAIPYSEKPWIDPALPLDERVEKLMAVMTPEDKMELLREGWGIPGIPRLGVPFINKVEAIHGFSYGSGATIFPQSIGLGATWNKQLVEEVAGVIGDETVSANTVQAWSPVLDVAQDARWGRCEETYGEDPILVSEIGGAWVKGYQSHGLFATPKHFAAHGAPLGGRDSHDIGLSEREMREIHLVPFRHVIKTYNCQAIMENYSDYMGVPVAKSRELLNGILRDEWGFDGFIVSDCGALGNLTDRKHYTAIDFVDAANQSLAAGVATNCGDTYNNKVVIEAAVNGRLNMENLERVCRGMLATLFRNGLFDRNPSKPLDWNKIYPGWNSPQHKETAHRAALESIVLLENKEGILPLSKGAINSVAVIGPGADDLQPGDYTPRLQPGQLKSVLYGIREKLGGRVGVNYAKGCGFTGSRETNLEHAIQTVMKSDVAILVLGDCSTSESTQDVKKTSGEGNDYASLILPGDQQKLLEAICETGKPVILVLQAGRPYNLSYASENCHAILVNWLPGQEGGPATADVLFGDYNPAGRLPMTFPRHVGQLPLYYNFKTSGRGYNYVDMSFYPLYPFGYGLSYTSFHYSDMKIDKLSDGTVDVRVTVSNIGDREGDEVVQLYVTDMYASVKTRVTELKDFTRITLAPGELQEVVFKLIPYQLSLLNDRMDRVVEPGEFRILAGGRSPLFVAADKIKDSVGYKTPQDGISGTLDYGSALTADFILSFEQFEKNRFNGGTVIAVKVTNIGNMTDTGRLTIYTDGVQEEIRHFELDPEQEKIIRFNVASTDIKSVTAASKYKTITHNF